MKKYWYIFIDHVNDSKRFFRRRQTIIKIQNDQQEMERIFPESFSTLPDDHVVVIVLLLLLHYPNKTKLPHNRLNHAMRTSEIIDLHHFAALIMLHVQAALFKYSSKTKK